MESVAAGRPSGRVLAVPQRNALSCQLPDAASCEGNGIRLSLTGQSGLPTLRLRRACDRNLFCA